MNISIPTPLPTPESAFAAYKPLVEGNPQAVPILLWASAKGTFPVAVIPPEDEPGMILADLYEHTVEQAITELGQPYWVVSSIEGWSTPVAPEEAETYQRGDAEKNVKAGRAGAGECVYIMGISTTEEWALNVPFERTEHRVRWGTPQHIKHSDGALADVLKRLVR